MIRKTLLFLSFLQISMRRPCIRHWCSLDINLAAINTIRSSGHKRMSVVPCTYVLCRWRVSVCTRQRIYSPTCRRQSALGPNQRVTGADENVFIGRKTRRRRSTSETSYSRNTEKRHVAIVADARKRIRRQRRTCVQWMSLWIIRTVGLEEVEKKTLHSNTFLVASNAGHLTNNMAAVSLKYSSEYFE